MLGGKPSNGVTILTTQNIAKPRSKPPVSAHPLFPAVVALWFGALFGLGSLAVRVSLIESLVLSLHFDVIIPAAAPPLGLLARIIVSLLMAALGIAVGAIIARWIARPKPVKRERQRSAGSIFGAREPRSEPLLSGSPVATLGIDGETGDAMPGRRRALALNEESRSGYSSDYHFNAAPVPGAAPQILDVTQIELTMPEPAPAPEPELTGETHADAAFDLADYETVSNLPTPHDGLADVVAQDFGPPQRAAGEVQPRQEFGFASEIVPETVDVALSPPPFSAPEPVPASSAAARIAGADLAELSPLELIERLALAMQQRRHSGPVPPVIVEAAAALGVPYAPELNRQDVTSEDQLEVASHALTAETEHTADADEALVLDQPEFNEPAPFRLELPAALRPIDLSEYEEIGTPDVFPLPPRSFGGFMAPSEDVTTLSVDEPAIVSTDADSTGQLVESEEAKAEEELEVEEDAYSSLLDLGRPVTVRQPFARIETPQADDDAIEPVVIFPGQQARVGTRFSKPTAAEVEALSAETSVISDEGAPRLRRFDSPAAIASVPAAPTPATANVDNGETERALRSALATLQRMSGAG